MLDEYSVTGGVTASGAYGIHRYGAKSPLKKSIPGSNTKKEDFLNQSGVNLDKLMHIYG